MGVYSVGCRWIKQPQGYRCTAGSYFISNDQLMRQQDITLEKKQGEEAQIQQALRQMGVHSASYGSCIKLVVPISFRMIS
jgi:hypothetical protein